MRRSRIPEPTAPALGRTVRSHPTGVVALDADGCKGPRRGKGPVRVARAPALDGAIGPQSTGMDPASADGCEGTGRWRGLAVRVPSPADDGTVGPHPATVAVAKADGMERATGRCRLPGFVGTPADDRTIAPHPATVPGSRTSASQTNGLERADRTYRLRIRLLELVAAPAGYRPFRCQDTHVFTLDADGNERPSGIATEAISRLPQHVIEPSSLTPQAPGRPVST